MTFRAHYHNVMEENFYILEGEVDNVKLTEKSTISQKDNSSTSNPVRFIM